VTSISLSVGIRLALAKQTARATGARFLILNVMVGTLASCAGGFANNVAMRQCELKRGVEITNPENGESLGLSKLAAQKAVIQTATSRIFLSAPIALPAFMLLAVERAGMMP